MWKTCSALPCLRLFTIASNQNASLADYLSLSLYEAAWHQVFRYPLRTWQTDMLMDLLARVQRGLGSSLHDWDDRVL
ncbi:hypothetical protein Dimus_033870 [Dionaea muscipula]